MLRDNEDYFPVENHHMVNLQKHPICFPFFKSMLPIHARTLYFIDEADMVFMAKKLSMIAFVILCQLGENEPPDFSLFADCAMYQPVALHNVMNIF